MMSNVDVIVDGDNTTTDCILEDPKCYFVPQDPFIFYQSSQNKTGPIGI